MPADTKKTTLNQNGGASVPVIILLVLIIGGLAAAGLYFRKDSEKKASEISQLRSLLSKFQDNNNPSKPPLKPTDLKQPEIPVKIEPSATCSLCDDIPVHVFSPAGLFTPAEKSELESKMVNPYFDYNNEEGPFFLTMLIQKRDPAASGGFRYDVNAISRSGVHHAFLFGNSTPLEWWQPDCLDDCTFSDEFRERYPEIVELSD